MTTIRDATPRDAEAIATILNQLIRNTTVTFQSIEKSAKEIATAIDTAEVYLVIEDEGEIKGYATFGPFRSGVGYSTVKEHSICLDIDARHSGYGAMLLSKLEIRARSLGVRHMIAGVSGENETGLKFHESQGYEIAGHLHGIGWKFNREIDLILMQKSL